jgi:hypothetical protein
MISSYVDRQRLYSELRDRAMHNAVNDCDWDLSTGNDSLPSFQPFDSGSESHCPDV